jgi:hypothetical protein
MSENTLANPATAKQEKYANSLLRMCANVAALTLEQDGILKRFQTDEKVSKDDMSYLIGGLLKCEQKPKAPQAAPGYYVGAHGEFINVVMNKAQTNTYAKVLNVTKEKGQRAKARWTYAPGVGAEVAHLTPLTIEKAAEFGHLNGVCIICCRALTDPESVQNGIGPVCAKKVGAPQGGAQVAAIVVNANGRAMKRR